MVERLVLAVVLLALAFAAYQLLKQRNLQRAAATAAVDPILDDFKPGIPAIVYFTTPGCIPCKTQQQPALSRLRTELGENNIQIIQIDAVENPDAADRWGVFSAPTTFILDPHGQPREVNHGVADAAKLKRQIELVA
ncbi:MAG TPA: thioredoxin family protein [Phototrophicaceae bacterium]|nr:thioredoxin family protein [Phototrophicaceae bacterium]